MPGTSCLYRRPSGIYAVRLVVPKRLRAAIGRTEIHTSTQATDLDAAKVAALKIQLYWREQFLTMDQAIAVNESVLVSIADVAASSGVSVSTLAAELHRAAAPTYVSIQNVPCWEVLDLSEIERDHDGTFIFNDVESNGERRVRSGVVRVFDSRAALGRWMVGAESVEEVLRDGKAGIWPDKAVRIAPSEFLTTRAAINRIRDRLTPTGVVPSAAPAPVTVVPASAPVIFDPTHAKHGQKRFSHLFGLLRQDRQWSAGTGRRNATEAQLFIDLMGDRATSRRKPCRNSRGFWRCCRQTSISHGASMASQRHFMS